MSPADIISRWPSAEVFADDLRLKFRSHGRVMRLRNSIPAKYWDDLLLAARRRGYSDINRALLEAAHGKATASSEGAAA